MGEEQSWKYTAFLVDAVSSPSKGRHIMAAHCGYCPDVRTAERFGSESTSKLGALKLSHHKFRKHVVAKHPDKLSEVKPNA